MVIPERLADDAEGPSRDGHECRYRLAAGFVAYGATVLDAACGTGYGAGLLAPHSNTSRITYRGVDISLPAAVHRCPQHRFVEADLATWEPQFPFHTAVSFETIEHMADYGPLVDLLKRAKHWILASVPVVPTVGVNPFHLHDFSPGELRWLFEDDQWRCYQILSQPAELSEVGIFCRR